MGCSDSIPIIQNKQKIVQKPQTIISQANRQWNYFLIGCISQKQSIFCKVNLTDYSINRMSLPQNFQAHNFLSMLQFSQGQYLISGGINHSLSQITADCYIYNAKLHQVQKILPMHQARYTHISLCANDCVYVFGGRYYGDDKIAILSRCQKYSFSQKKWIVLPSMNQKRCTGFSFVWKKQIYVMGGYTGPFERSVKIEYLTENESVWKILDFQLNRGIQSAIAFSYKPNQITIFGGLTNSGATDSVITINLLKKQIISNKKIKQMRSLHKSFYYEKKMHIFGGDQQLSLQCYQIGTQESKILKQKINFNIQDFDNFGYSTKTIIVDFQNDHIVQHIPIKKQQLFIFGTTQQPFIVQIDLQNFQVIKNSVPLSIKLSHSQGIVTINQKQFILFGGSQDQQFSIALAQTYFYNHKQRKTKKLQSMNQSRYAFTYQYNKNNNCILVIGGATTNENKRIYLDICQKYVIDKNKWQIVAKLPQKLIDTMSLTFKDKIYVFGGQNNEKQLNKNVYKYDISLNKWLSLDFSFDLKIRKSTVYQMFQDRFYLFGGKGQAQQQKSEVWSINFKSQKQFHIQNSGKLSEKMISPTILRPKKQNFYLIFGGKSVLSFYQLSKTNFSFRELKQQKLNRLRQHFCQSTIFLNERNIQKYLIIA